MSYLIVVKPVERCKHCKAVLYVDADHPKSAKVCRRCDLMMGVPDGANKPAE